MWGGACPAGACHLEDACKATRLRVMRTDCRADPSPRLTARARHVPDALDAADPEALAQRVVVVVATVAAVAAEAAVAAVAA
eukprot:6355318-Lingulodinium_polyedra.AAC.1